MFKVKLLSLNSLSQKLRFMGVLFSLILQQIDR